MAAALSDWLRLLLRAVIAWQRKVYRRASAPVEEIVKNLESRRIRRSFA
ncbi:hypothetical protein BURKHO8Y_140298 [Burkholderia sp. 8Y]|nr:hypothetical protein BURKHO8Y_140298 [Burkholderia sp. 8Y]